MSSNLITDTVVAYDAQFRDGGWNHHKTCSSMFEAEREIKKGKADLKRHGMGSTWRIVPVYHPGRLIDALKAITFAAESAANLRGLTELYPYIEQAKAALEAFKEIE